MCGIAGYVGAEGTGPPVRATIEAMCQTMVHRGPDDQGIYLDDSVALGMRRLSIIDLSTGHQPISNETNRIWVVLNGEIYNYRELAVWLRGRGHTLVTSSDTEVIVHLYEELGDECVHKLRGMFAFALWDKEQDRLLIARDRLGVKPLYYYWDEQQLIFGSELKAVLAHPAVERQLDPHALLYYLRYSYVPDPLSIFKNISKLPPGCLLTLCNSRLNIRSYWNGAIASQDDRLDLSEEEASIQLEERLQEAVNLRLISDVPLGAFLSGGLDSSLVVALMAHQIGRPVSTFSIGFEEPTYNELPYARMVAKHFSTDHHELIVGPQSCGLIERLVAHFDEPFGDASAIPMYHLSKLASESVKVALSGDGGDELFAGYDRYRVDLERHRYQRWPNFTRQALGRASDALPEGFPAKSLFRNISLPARSRYLDNISYFAPGQLHKLLMPEVYHAVSADREAEAIMMEHFEVGSNEPWLSQLQYIDTKTYLPADVMTKVDRMSMAHSLEAREPLLDHELFEYVTRLPVSMKFQNGISKYMLRRMAQKYLPTEILQRKKQGFGVPLEFWFKEDLKQYVNDVLFNERTRTRGLFNQCEVSRLVQQYEGGRRELATTIWMLLILETWCRIYLDGVPPLSCTEPVLGFAGSPQNSATIPRL
ncbi:asparagine synthase (glutamine-hydrolyzing) [Nitrospira sp. Nam74]